MPDMRDVSPHRYVRCSPLGSCPICSGEWDKYLESED